MVGVWGGRDRSYAAMKLTIYLTLGAMVSLLGLIMLYVKSGAHTFDLIALRDHLAAHPLAASVQNNIAGLLLFGLGVLVSLWPLHTWAPLGYGAAPSSAAMLHAGVLKNSASTASSKSPSRCSPTDSPTGLTRSLGSPSSATS